LKGVPLPDLKEALAEFWVKRREEEEQGAVGGEDRHADESVDVDEKNESLEIVRMKLEVEREKIALEKERMQMEKERMQLDQRRLQEELDLKRLELEHMAALKKDKLRILETRMQMKRRGWSQQFTKQSCFQMRYGEPWQECLLIP